MTSKRDIPKLKRLVLLSDVASRSVELKKKGSEFLGLCPFHTETNPSFTIYDGDNGFQLYKCHGCGKGGDVIDFMQETQGFNKSEAIKELEALAGGAEISSVNNAEKQHIARPAKKDSEWIYTAGPQAIDLPDAIRIQRDEGWVEWPVTSVWVYRATDGGILSVIARLDIDGKKDIRQFSWMTNTVTGVCMLRPKAAAEPRSLYGAELLAERPKANILLVEGEKAADAARALFPSKNLIVMTWPGGSNAVDKADWSLLAGRKVVGWPDCDGHKWGDSHPEAGQFKPYHLQTGMAAMLRITEIVAKHDAKMMIVKVPQPGGEWFSGYDLADALAEGKDGKWAMEYLQANLSEPSAIVPQDPGPCYEHGYQGSYEDEYHPADIGDAPSAPDSADDQSEKLKPVKMADVQEFSSNVPFQLLGMDQGRCYYLPDGISQVCSLTSSQHTKLNLFHLADLSYWQNAFASDKKGGDGVNWDMAVNTMMRASEKAGIYEPERIRGRGAWWDRDKWAVHLGNKVIMSSGEDEAVSYPLRAVPSDFIYQAGKKINISIDDPLPTADAFELVKILEKLRWERPINAKLLAGYIFLAPVCGAIDWRPHVHITGGAGSGKSTVMTRIVGCCLEGIGLKVEGDTSEAGLRQALAHDARPIIFDEFESDRKKAAERVDDIISMVIRSSSETGAELYKGGADGKFMSYKSRAMFIFASIGVNIKQHAARTRICVMGLVSSPETPESQEKFKDISRHITETLTPSYVSRLQARAVRMIPTIRKNCEVFSEAAAIHLSDRRMGDQIGALLAGAYGLHSSNVISLEMAKDYIQSQTWDEVEETKEDSDEAKLLKHLLSRVVRVEVAIGSPRTRNIASLMARAGKLAKDHEITEGEAREHLAMLGMLVTSSRTGPWDPYVLFANEHNEIQTLLRDTPWISYGRTLKRIPSATKCAGRNIGGITTRSIQVPLRDILIADTASD